MRSRRLKLKSDKTECILVTENDSMHRNVDTHSVMLGSVPVKISNNVRNLGFVFDNQLNFDEQVHNVTRKVIVNLTDFFSHCQIYSQRLEIKLVHRLVFSVIEFCNSLLYGSPNIILNCLHMLINSAARIIVDFPRF